MSNLERVKFDITNLSESERWELREWLDAHTVDLDATYELRQLLQVATEALGDENSARIWLQSAAAALGQEVPAIVARRSPEDFAAVSNLLERIRSGDTFV